MEELAGVGMASENTIKQEKTYRTSESNWPWSVGSVMAEKTGDTISKLATS
jgi:hypothetical protein